MPERKAMVFGIAALIIGIKGFGGSFNSFFNYLGIGFYHGPIIGSLFAFFLVLYLLQFQNVNLPSIPSALEHRNFKFSVIAIYLLLLLFSFIAKIKAIHHIPIDILRADMLPAIEAECNGLLNGVNPYGPLTFKNGSVILHGYPILLILSYLPLAYLHIDLRYLNIFAQGVYYLLFLNLFLRKKVLWFNFQWKDCALFIFLVSLHLFSKQGLKETVDIHTAPYWLFYSLLLWTLSYSNYRLAFWILPLFCLCREPAILLVIPLLIYLFLKERKIFITGISKSIILGGIIILPFLIWDFNAFFAGIFFYANHIYESPLEDMVRFYGLSGILRQCNIIYLQKPLQLTGLFAALFLVYKRRATITLGQSLALGGLSYLTLMLFVSLSYQFIYCELIILTYTLVLWPATESNRLLSGK